MSVVTNIILATFLENVEQADGTDTWPPVEAVNAWLAENHHPHARLVYVGNQSHGGKAMECDVWIGAFNYLRLNDFLAAVRSAPWEWPEQVQVFVRKQDDDVFTERLHGSPS